MNHKTETEVKAERSAKRFYTGLVLLLFAIQCTILGTALKLAVGDPALAVVPDYHQAALNWDATQAANGAAAKMGWDVEIEVSDVADGRGMRAMQLLVSDQTGKPVTDLKVLGKAYHHAAANQVERFELNNVGEGRYMAMPPMGRKGLWQIELQIQNAGEPMSLVKTVEFKS
ncbi:FixH family protein [Aporhodopirellula aestuarii]|uniref:FixH family protein n=1 Tax=Aporhodopirellula aestuarii TaxID=2950107 RepID=A0ABT0UEQ7_9BACT|nr:FixH family protein [Aporhodopirellula aestuarii]MCM2375201.1 FixH family protein [Aporhodopirellula aestuarii]